MSIVNRTGQPDWGLEPITEPPDDDDYGGPVCEPEPETERDRLERIDSECRLTGGRDVRDYML